MAKKDKVVMASDFLNFLRFSLDESAASTFTQLELDTNLSAERGIMMEIHQVEFELLDMDDFSSVAAGGQETIQVQVTRDSKTAAVSINDADVIARIYQQISRSAAIGTDAGPLYHITDNILTVSFPLPIPYVKPSMFVGIIGSAAGVSRVRGRIGYTLRDITREEFLELLVALQ